MFRWRIEFSPHHLFIGGLWKDDGLTLDVWVCLVPCICLHLQWGQDWSW